MEKTFVITFIFKDDDADTIRQAFKIFDRDKDGYISTKELKKVLLFVCLFVCLYFKTLKHSLQPKLQVVG